MVHMGVIRGIFRSKSMGEGMLVWVNGIWLLFKVCFGEHKIVKKVLHETCLARPTRG